HPYEMALSIGFRIISLLPSCYSSYGALDSYPGGTLTHCSCQPSLDAHFSGLFPGQVPVPSGPSSGCRRSRAYLRFFAHFIPTPPLLWLSTPRQGRDRFSEVRMKRPTVQNPNTMKVTLATSSLQGTLK